MLIWALVLIWRAISVIIWVLFIYALLTWIPNIRWDKQPFALLRNFAEFFFKPFRFLPPIGILDISPMACFITLLVIQYLIGWIIKNILI